MRLSTIVLVVWVILVSVWARGWAAGSDITLFILIAGFAYAIVRLLESLGALDNFQLRRRA